MSTRDLASIKWRERETPQGLLLATRRLSFFLAFFELSKYVYIYRLQSFLLHEQTIAAGWQFHKLVWKGKILDFFLPFLSLTGYCVSCPSQPRTGLPSVSGESNQALWWSHRFSSGQLVSSILSKSAIASSRDYLMSISATRGPDRRKITTQYSVVLGGN